jgi:alkylated DNA repair dioxygenase AlkB
VPDLDVHRGWNGDPGLLAAVKELFAYDADSRANGYLYLEGGQDWPPSLAEYGPKLLVGLEQLLGVRFTVALFQAYRDGSGVHWHTDAGYDWQAILSLGVTRTFAVRRSGEDPVWVPLHNGDLAVMPSGFQPEWEHCVPAEDVTGERVSLVFRAVTGS